MESYVPWISLDALSSNDFESICSEITNSNYSCSQTQKYASFYLSKKFNLSGPSRSNTASLILIYCALVLEGDDLVTTIPLTLLTYSPEDWLKCLEDFKSRTKNKHVIRDCVHCLFKIGRLTFEDLLRAPMMLAALAHRISYQHLMEPMANGKSVVFHVLEKHSRPLRFNFLESLHGAYKDDFKHVITPFELNTLIQKDLRRCLRFLLRTGLRFPAVDSTLCYLVPSVTEILVGFSIEPVTPTSVSDFTKGLYEESRRPFELRKKSAKEVLDHITPFLNIYYDLYYRPRVDLRDKFGTIFPFMEMPAEIIELVVRDLDSRTTQALKCLSKASKAFSIDAQQVMRAQYPRKYHVLNSNVNPRSTWDSIYWNDAVIQQHWNTGKFKKIIVPGIYSSMDENIIVASVPPDHGWRASVHEHQYFFIKWTDSTMNKYLLKRSSTEASLYERHDACIVDSNSEDPILALVAGKTMEIFIGTNPVSKFKLLKEYVTSSTMMSCNKKIYIDDYVYEIGERLVWYQTLEEYRNQLVDVNPMNDMYLANERHRYDNYVVHHKLKVYSNQRELIGHLSNSERLRYFQAKFLDEHQFVCVSYDGIDFADVRKLDQIITSVPAKLGSHTIDPLNRRIINCSQHGGLVTVFDLDSRKWIGGFHPQGYEDYSFRTELLHANTRFLVREEPAYMFSVFDFK